MLSIPDMALLGAAALMFFGPEQLPKVARKVGLLVRDVQNTSQSFIREMERAGDDHAYNPDISRAHLIEEAAGTTPAAPVTYEPPAYEPATYEPASDHPYAAVESYAEHTEHAESSALPEHATTPGETPVLHDIVAPHAQRAAGDHDLPP